MKKNLQNFPRGIRKKKKINEQQTFQLCILLIIKGVKIFFFEVITIFNKCELVIFIY